MRIPEKWTFKDSEVADNFDKHVREQLPWYDIATGAMAHAARHFVQRNGLVIDLGASTGNVEKALSKILEERSASFIAVDDSKEMKDNYRGKGEFVLSDIVDFKFPASDLIVAFLSLMFISVNQRRDLIARMKGSIRPGGGIIVFDKISPPNGYTGIISMRLALAAKYENGAAPEEIIQKELSLIGVQRPLYESELDGFQEYFRFGDFAGYIYDAGV